MKTDTIAAIATAPGASGVGIVRLSGPEAGEILSRVLAVEALEDRRVGVGQVRDHAGRPVDEVIYFFMKGPRSFTGEDVAEIQGHGGSANMERLLGVVLAAGARLAEPGEFTRRAFEQGRIDLVRAEAILGVVQATHERAARLAQRQLSGELGQVIRGLFEECRAIFADIEADIDFPDAELEVWRRDERRARLAAVATRCTELAATYPLGRALTEGLVVVLAGPVNAGKSSLFNALCGQERALVGEEPGTTRDFIEVRCEWQGLQVTLVDTAGRRSDASALEKRGRALAEHRMASADLVVELYTDPAQVPAAAPRTLPILSKADLQTGASRKDVIATSAKTGAGLELLKGEILRRVVGDTGEEADPLVVTSERQRVLLAEAGQALRKAIGGIAEELPAEVIALEVRTAAERLGTIFGEQLYEGMLDELFRRFCIGK